MSCSSPEKVAEKALQEIGNGKFVSSPLGFSIERIEMFTSKNSIYSRRLIKSEIAEDIFEKGFTTLDEEKLEKTLFEIDCLFNDFVFSSKIESTIDLYSCIFNAKSEENKLMVDAFKKAGWEYVETETDFAYIPNHLRNIPFTMLKYKIDNKYIITVDVVKLPHEGYKVVSVHR